MEPVRTDKDLTRYFSARGAALKVISHALEDAEVIRIATAYFEPTGYQLLSNLFKGKEVRLLLGRSETGDDKIQQVISEFFDALSSGSFEDRTRAMEELRDAIAGGRFLVSVSEEGEMQGTTLSPKYLYQHAKLYMADEKRVVVSSSNFTHHGLVTSREAGITVTDHDDVQYFVERFDQFYEKAIPVADELLARLEEWLKIYRPWDIYIRSLLELYGLPEDEKPVPLPVLSNYQRPVVSRVLRTMEEYGGAMLVASTGLGKTIMAAHVLAYMSMQKEIDSAIVLCPAGLKKMWQRTMRAARISSMEFSYYILSMEDWQRYRDIPELEHELRYANEKTVIVLDESHHMRNSEDGKQLRLQHERIIDAVRRKSKILLMTATPYSKDVKDINNQLLLLPRYVNGVNIFNDRELVHWDVTTPADLSSLQSCVVLTTPTVVSHFSYTDSKGERFVLFSGNDKRYFPRKIHMRNIHYNNPCDDMLHELIKSGVMHVQSSEYAAECLFEDKMSGKRDPLFEARVVHQFCSSIKAIDSLLEKMEQEGGYEKLRFENQKKLTGVTAEMRRKVSPYLDHNNANYQDEKINKVTDIINDFPGKKIVIFCYYRETSKYVAEKLEKIFPQKGIKHTVDGDPNEVEDIIRKFAPVANTIDLGDVKNSVLTDNGSDGIDILVATTKMSEGFNFQDASIVINFDLPWTVLILAQRMGRVLRPWQEPREIYVYTLMPSTMGDERIHHAMNWKDRLLNRGREFKSFADIPVIVEKGSEVEMLQLARSVQQAGDSDLELDDILKFIDNAENIQTSSFIDDLAELEERQAREYRRLPDGIKSYKSAEVKENSLYLLFRKGQRLYPAICDGNGKVLINSNNMDEIMRIIRSESQEEPPVPCIEPDSLDKWIEISRNEWAAKNGFLPGELSIVCYMVLMPVTC